MDLNGVPAALQAAGTSFHWGTNKMLMRINVSCPSSHLFILHAGQRWPESGKTEISVDAGQTNWNTVISGIIPTRPGYPIKPNPLFTYNSCAPLLYNPAHSL